MTPEVVEAVGDMALVLVENMARSIRVIEETILAEEEAVTFVEEDATETEDLAEEIITPTEEVNGSEFNKGKATGYMDLMGRDGKTHRWMKPAPKSGRGGPSTTPLQNAYLNVTQASANLQTLPDVERTASRVAQSSSISNIRQNTADAERRTADAEHMTSNTEQTATDGGTSSSRQFPPNGSSSEDTDNSGGGIALQQSQVVGESISDKSASYDDAHEGSWDEDILDYNGQEGGNQGKAGYYYW
ncbi:MAG: hypothetical protein Q9209_001164 [Squamulea sp. 1 TL-2023]